MSKTTVITRTPAFTVSYPNVFNAKMNPLNGKEEFSCVALFKKGADLSEIQAKIDEVATAKFGPKAKWPKNLRSPLRDQGDKAKEDEETGKTILPQGYEKGAMFMTLKSVEQPGIVDQSLKTMHEPKDFYAGVKARATISIYAYDQMGNKGVGVGLRNLQKVADGTALGNRVAAEDDFAPIEDSETETENLLA